MQYIGAKLNYNFKTLYVEDLSPDCIMSAKETEDKFWYVLYHDKTIAGCIGSREYARICETGKAEFKKDFLFLNVGEDEKQNAIELFTKNMKIRKIPVLDAEGKLLYEYVRSVEAYYEDVGIRCGIHKAGCGFGDDMDSRQEKIVVSLTSYGKRLDTVHIAVKSLMVQTMKADEIILYIAKEDSQKKIRQEDSLIKAGLTIVRNVIDLKPHKKYFYAMREYQEAVILTVDDDTIYDDRLIEDLYTKHLEYPEAVICRRGHRMTKQGGRIASYDLWEGCVESRVPEMAICATGIGGILYPCGEYRKSFLDEKGILKTSLCGDDLWLKAVELMKSVAVYAIGEIPARVIEGSQEEALYVENADNKRNDEYLDKLQDYFNINLADLF